MALKNLYTTLLKTYTHAISHCDAIVNHIRQGEALLVCQDYL